MFITRIGILITLITLTACSQFGGEDKTPLTGDREEVLLNDAALKPNESLTGVQVRVPYPEENANWPQAGGCASHAIAPVELGDELKVVWDKGIGGGSSSDRRLLSEPVVFNGVLYVLNSRSEVRAVKTSTGELLWETSISPEDSSSGALGGGVAYADGKVYVSSAHAEVMALDASDGNVLWRVGLSSPSRTSPTVKDGRVFAVSINNELYAINGENGKVLWTHSGIMETAGILGGASPSVYGDVVVVPYSSGEVFALRVENGHVLWSESLASFRYVDSVSSLPHIRARPVIHDNIVYLVSHSGRMAALRLRDGKILWDREIGGIQSPAVAGDFIFVVTSNNELVCLTRSQGLVRWSKVLPKYADEEAKTDKLVWSGPLVAGDRLILNGSNGQMLILSVYEGQEIAALTLPGRTLLPPIVAEKSLFVLTDAGSLVAMQ